MSDETLNPNFEWKKKGFGKKERLSKGIDATQAVLNEIRKKNDLSSVTTTTNSTFSVHLRKMHKKIKEALDEEDDEDEDENSFVYDTSLSALMEQQAVDNSLFQSLNETEKKIIRQRHTLNNIKMLQDAAKLNALSKVNQLAQETGLKKLSSAEFAENMQNNGWGKETFQMALTHDVAPDIKVGLAKLDEQKAKDLMRGLKRLERIGGFSTVRGMKINVVIKITNAKYDDKKVAKLLLQKTGRKPDIAADRRAAKQREQERTPKVSFKKLLQQKQEQKAMKV